MVIWVSANFNRNISLNVIHPHTNNFKNMVPILTYTEDLQLATDHDPQLAIEHNLQLLQHPSKILAIIEN